MIRIKVHEKHTTLEDVDDAFKSQAYNLMENSSRRGSSRRFPHDSSGTGNP